MKNKSIYHWLIVIACCALAMTSMGLTYNCMGIFYTPIATDLGVGRGSVALYYTIVLITASLMGPLVVRAIGKFHIRKLMTFGTLLIAVSLTALSGVRSVWLLYVFALAVGVGQAFSGILPISVILGNWFVRKHGFAMGLALSCSGLGGAVFNPVINSIITAYGWRIGFVVMASIIAAVSLPGILFVIRLNPAEKGFLPYGSESQVIPSASLCGLEAANASGKKKNEMIPIIFSLPFLFSFIYIFCNNLTGSIGTHFPSYALSIGFSSAAGASMVSAIMFGNILFKLILGYLSDRIGPVKAGSIILIVIATALAVFTFATLSSLQMILVFAFMFGASYSINIVGVPLIVHHLFGREWYAKVYSYLNGITRMVSAFMVSIIGYIYDKTGSYHIAFFACMCTAMAGFLMVNIIGCMKPHIKEDQVVAAAKE